MGSWILQNQRHPMIDRQLVKLPSILFQFMDAFFADEPDREGFQQTLDYIGVTEAQLRDPAYEFDGEQLFRMLDLLHRASDDEPAAFRVLEHLSVSHLGMAGIAGLTAFTLGDAMRMAHDFHKHFLPFIDLELSNDKKFAELRLSVNADYGNYTSIITEIIIGALKQFGDQFTGDTLDALIHFKHAPAWKADETSTEALYESRLHCTVRFNQTRTAIRFPVSYLEKRLKQQNPVMHSYAKGIFDKEVKRKTTSDKISDKARSILEHAVENELPLSLERMAEELHMSTRTLSRKLARENTSFKALLNDIRFEHAKSLLRQTDIPIKQLAAKLGFANSDAFSRAFKAYTGHTPLGWRSGD